MESSDKYDVFISFKAKENDQPTRDAQIARELKEFLENYGVKTFYSDQDVRDSNYSDSIDRALEEAKLLFLIGTKKEYLDAFRSAGLKVTHDPIGLDGRGLYIGIKPVE